MNKANKIREIFRTAFDLPGDAMVDDLTYRGIPSWDSLGHMRLIAALETEFDVMFETQDILDLSNFSKGLAILEKYGVES